MKVLLPIVWLLSGTVMAATNQSTICTFGDKQRKIDLVYPEGAELPCEVQYTKSTGMTVLWNAQAQLGYCEEKYAEFVEKQKGWGWSCEAIATAEETTESEPEPGEGTGK